MFHSCQFQIRRLKRWKLILQILRVSFHGPTGKRLSVRKTQAQDQAFPLNQSRFINRTRVLVVEDVVFGPLSFL